MVRHGHVGRGGQLEAFNRNAEVPQGVDFAQHHFGIDHRARADQTDGFGVEDARGDQVQFEHSVLNHNRVAGIDPALVTHHHIGGAAQQIRDLALALVTPLRTDDDDVGQGQGGP